MWRNGRRTGLKIRWDSPPVPVRVRPSAPLKYTGLRRLKVVHANGIVTVVSGQLGDDAHRCQGKSDQGSNRESLKMNEEKAYMKVVEWSEEDGCYIGSAPPLIGPSCHGDTEEDVYRQLSVIVPDVIATYRERGFPLPESSSGKEYSGKILARVRPELHRALVIRAMMEHRSLNSYIETALERSCLGKTPKKA